MTDQSNRLTKSSGFTIKDIIRMSHQYYKSKAGDDKAKRSNIDVLNAKITLRNNYNYNQSAKKWEQSGRDVRIDFICRTDPKSYKKTDNIKIHKYPITIIIHSIELGINSTFKWRTGSLKKPIFSKPGMSSQQVAEKNIRNGIQMGFFFEQEFVLRQHNLLFGRCYANRPPIKTNPKGKIFADKHFWFILQHFLVRMLQTNGGSIVSFLIRGNKI